MWDLKGFVSASYRSEEAEQMRGSSLAVLTPAQIDCLEGRQGSCRLGNDSQKLSVGIELRGAQSSIPKNPHQFQSASPILWQCKVLAFLPPASFSTPTLERTNSGGDG